MRLSKEITKLYLKKHPEFAKFVDRDGCLIVRLLKCLYGLKQAGLGWNDELSKTLINDGFLTQSRGDVCLFYKIENGKYILLVKHVDDLLLSTNSSEMTAEVKKALSKYGKLTWESKSFTYLGMEIQQLEDHSVKVSMQAMTKKILEKHSINRTADCPSNTELFNNKDEVGTDYSKNSTDYKSKTYELMYLDRVRIDIKKECGELASLSNNPGEDSYKKLSKVQEYLSSTAKNYIILGADSPQVNVHIDAAYAVHEDSKSHSGIYITLGNNGGPILVKSFKQKMVTNSSTEAELLALVDGIKKSLPLTKIMHELHLIDNPKATIWQDNLSTIAIAENGEGVNGKAKHFRVRYHFLKEMIEEASIEIKHCRSENMIADFLTKPMSGHLFKSQVDRAMRNGK